jgi:ubiquinone/menaquinone biosynthesis C-methylase UbiE
VGGIDVGAMDQVFQDGRKYVLHVGCGSRNPEGLHQVFRDGTWTEVRLDVDPAVEPDIVASIVSMPQVPDASVEAVWSSHNLEHLFAHEVPTALKEFRRVLRPGGFVLLTMPDLQQAAAMIAEGLLEDTAYESPAGPIAPIDVCFGHRPSIAAGNHFMAHKTGFSAQTLDRKLADCGYERIRVTREFLSLWAVAHKPA